MRENNRLINPKKNSVMALILLFIIILPFLVGDYEIYILILCIYYMVQSESWNLLAGYAGLFNMAQHTSAALAAYASGLLCIYFSLPPILTIFPAIVVAGLVSWFIGQFTIKMESYYLSLTTWGFAVIFHILIVMNWQITGGNLGLEVPYFLGSIRSGVAYYFLFLFSAIAMILIMYKIVNGKLGLYLKAIRDDELAAAVMGVDVFKTRKTIFIYTGLISGFFGVLYGHYMGVLTPNIMGWEKIFIIILSVTIGGKGSFLGPLFGAILIKILSELLRWTGEAQWIVFGILLIVTMKFSRGGIEMILKKIYLKYLKGEDKK